MEYSFDVPEYKKVRVIQSFKELFRHSVSDGIRESEKLFGF